MDEKRISELRTLRGRGMISAVGEYTPEELWEALDEVERLHSLARLADVINAQWIKRYGGEPVTDEGALARRVILIADDRDCWLANAKVNQAEYLKLDKRFSESGCVRCS